MNNTTPASFDSLAPPVEQRWMSIVFMQGEEANEVLDMIDKNGAETAIQHLSQWDIGDETRDAALVNGYVYEDIPQSPTDRVIRDKNSGYALTYNHQFWYVSLLRRFDPVVEDVRESVAPPAVRIHKAAAHAPRERAPTVNLTDAQLARVALSTISEPGDTVTGTLIQLLGAPDTLRMISTRDALPDTIDPTGSVR